MHVAQSAEILALLNYESKPDQPVRREGIAIMDIDPESSDFGNLDGDSAAVRSGRRRIFFNRDKSKAYLTALGKSILHVVNLKEFLPLRAIAVPDCQVGEDLVVSEDNRTWYLRVQPLLHHAATESFSERRITGQRAVIMLLQSLLVVFFSEGNPIGLQLRMQRALPIDALIRINFCARCASTGD